jgi:hypothetical protein
MMPFCLSPTSRPSQDRTVARSSPTFHRFAGSEIRREIASFHRRERRASRTSVRLPAGGGWEGFRRMPNQRRSILVESRSKVDLVILLLRICSAIANLHSASHCRTDAGTMLVALMFKTSCLMPTKRASSFWFRAACSTMTRRCSTHHRMRPRFRKVGNLLHSATLVLG